MSFSPALPTNATQICPQPANRLIVQAHYSSSPLQEPNISAVWQALNILRSHFLTESLGLKQSTANEPQ